MGVPSPICRGPGIIPDPHPRFAGDRGFIPIPIPDLPKSGIQLSTIEYCKGVDCSGSPQCLTLIVNCHQSSLLIFEGRQCPMTPLTTARAAAATRVIRSPPGSQLERNRAFWRMISASVMQLSDAHHHRRNRPRSASVTRSPATAPRRASSASSSDTSDPSSSGDDSH